MQRVLRHGRCLAEELEHDDFSLGRWDRIPLLLGGGLVRREPQLARLLFAAEACAVDRPGKGTIESGADEQAQIGDRSQVPQRRA